MKRGERGLLKSASEYCNRTCSDEKFGCGGASPITNGVRFRLGKSDHDLTEFPLLLILLPLAVPFSTAKFEDSSLEKEAMDNVCYIRGRPHPTWDSVM